PRPGLVERLQPPAAQVAGAAHSQDALRSLPQGESTEAKLAGRPCEHERHPRPGFGIVEEDQREISHPTAPACGAGPGAVSGALSTPPPGLAVRRRSDRPCAPRPGLASR